jgi:signal transduction histidine kinase
MAEQVPTAESPRSSRLFYQIALRLAAVTAAFMVLEVLIVVAMYIDDEATLGEDLISLESERIAHWLDDHPSTPLSEPMFQPGSTRAFAVFDESGTLVLAENKGSLPLPDEPIRDLQSLTTRERHGERYFISGIRRFEIDGRPYSIAMAISDQGLRPLIPALIKEVIDHALIPLIPLSLLLLTFNIAAVRRLLAPLERAMDDVNALDPSAMDRRLNIPASPIEVRSLLTAINRALDRLQKTMLTLRQFTADAAHELRTPLAVMTLSIDRLPASEEKERLREDAAAMSRLIGQMLDLARADALDDAKDSQADLHQMASHLAAEMAPLAFRKGKSLSYRHEGNPVARGRSELLERALRNLIENALTHTAPGSNVEVSVGPGPRLSVQDRGPGIPAAMRDKVFDRFWRADRRHSGAGLGLAITRSIVEACGGRIELRDANGGGTIACLELIEPENIHSSATS